VAALRAGKLHQLGKADEIRLARGRERKRSPCGATGPLRIGEAGGEDFGVGPPSGGPQTRRRFRAFSDGPLAVGACRPPDSPFPNLGALPPCAGRGVAASPAGPVSPSFRADLCSSGDPPPGRRPWTSAPPGLRQSGRGCARVRANPAIRRSEES